MNKKEFDKHIKSLENQILILEKLIQHSKTTFTKECKHPADKITVKRNWFENDYGRYVPEWDTYTYTCTRCNSYFTVEKKFTDEKAMRKQFGEKDLL